MTSIYANVPLKGISRGFRILKLSPLGTSASTVVLRGCLITARLDQKPPDYAALSYVWGPPEYTHSITLNDSHILSITETLFDALKELALDRANTGGGLSLWIDQICINQTDGSEKTCQVQMMSRIFSQARLVIGWLGPAEGDSNEAMDIFRYFSLNSYDPKKAILGQELCRRLKLECTVDEGGRPVNPLKQENNRAWLACVALLDRPWFTRLWIVQEMMLARELEFRCGSATISNTELSAVLRSNEWRARNVVGSVSKTLTDRFSLTQSVHGRLSYVYLAHMFQGRDCGYDHDRLIALNGIAQTMLYTPEERRKKWFLPDYTIPVMELYYNFAKGYLEWNQQSKIKDSRGLDILHYAGLSSSLASH